MHSAISKETSPTQGHSHFGHLKGAGSCGLDLWPTLLFDASKFWLIKSFIRHAELFQYPYSIGECLHIASGKFCLFQHTSSQGERLAKYPSTHCHRFSLQGSTHSHATWTRHPNPFSLPICWVTYAAADTSNPYSLYLSVHTGEYASILSLSWKSTKVFWTCDLLVMWQCTTCCNTCQPITQLLQIWYLQISLSLSP